jgi:hypothetical protein
MDKKEENAHRNSLNDESFSTSSLFRREKSSLSAARRHQQRSRKRSRIVNVPITLLTTEFMW